MNNTKEFDMSANNFSVTCRLCLSVNESLIQLFRSEEIETSAIPFSMKVTLCTTIRISKQDALPKKVCQNCANYINEWYKFRKKCVNNELYLKQCLSNSFSGKASETADEEKIESCNFINGDTTNDATFVEKLGIGDNIAAQASKASDSLWSDSADRNRIECDTDLTNGAGNLLLKPSKKKYKCSYCPDSFYYMKDLKFHKSVIHKVPRSEKPSNKEVVPSKVDTMGLEGVNRRARYEMKCCEKVFFSKARFRRHYNFKHPGEKPYMCETCGKKDFISEETLKRHKILHTGKYRCDICFKTFTCNAILIIHKRDKHENDKPFICDICGKRFVTELLMNYHKRFHTGEKKYVCEECGLAVVTSSSLAKHKRIHSNVKPHICQICGKGFIIKGRLVEHLRVHTGERPYSCHICHKGFTMRDKLKRHIRIHSGEKLFSCEYCGNNYSTSYGLNLHLKTHAARKY